MQQLDETGVKNAGLAYEHEASSHSLRPVQLDAAPAGPDRTYDVLTGEWDMAERRRRLGRIVFGAVAACGIILAAAGIRLAVTSPASAPAATATQVAATNGNPAAGGPAAAPAAADAPAAPPSEVAVPANAEDKSADSPVAVGTARAPTGTLLLQRPAAPGHVWLDDEKVTSATSTVACGKHEIRVGAHGHAHRLDVPCGGEIRVAK